MPKTRSQGLAFIPLFFTLGAQASELTCANGEIESRQCVTAPKSYKFTKHFLYSETTNSGYQFTNICANSTVIYLKQDSQEISRSVIESKSSLLRDCLDQGCKGMAYVVCQPKGSTDLGVPDGSTVPELPETISRTNAAPEVPPRGQSKAPNATRIDQSETPSQSEALNTTSAAPVVDSPETVSNARDVAQPKFNKRLNVDIRGSDMGSAQQLNSLDDCQGYCLSTSGCLAYTYDRWNRVCYLKDGVGSLRFEPRASSGFRSEVSIPFVGDAPIEKWDHRALRGIVESTINADSLLECQEACAAQSTCIGFTFSPATSVCSAFSRVDGWDRSRTADSGLKRQPP